MEKLNDRSSRWLLVFMIGSLMAGLLALSLYKQGQEAAWQARHRPEAEAACHANPGMVRQYPDSHRKYPEFSQHDYCVAAYLS